MLATLGIYARRIWHHAASDDLFFLASGLAFSILLAALPFVLLVVAGLALLLGQSPDTAAASAHAFLDQLLPAHAEGRDSAAHRLVDEVLRARGTLGLWSAVIYLWFSARLWGALRSALARVLDTAPPRGIIAGKLFDFRMTFATSALVVAYVTLNAYIAVATSGAVRYLVELGLREDVMGGLEYLVGRLISLLLVFALFWGVYRYIPVKRLHTSSVVLGAVTASALFEVAREVYAVVTASAGPATLYAGTLYTIVSVVFWVYYAAFILLLGGEVARVHELRRLQLLPQRTHRASATTPSSAHTTPAD